MLTNRIRAGIHHVWLVETWHSSLINVFMTNVLVSHCLWRVWVHLNLLLLHINALTMLPLMNTLYRVKTTTWNALIILAHLIGHLHVLIHSHGTLVLHRRLRMHDSHCLVWHILHWLLLSVLYVLNTLLMWLHLINMYLILLIAIFKSCYLFT